jgi:2-polyprenyl-3-methyl-5-hydroxy-6-metoxy-1,4-benzoquinol methylase
MQYTIQKDDYIHGGTQKDFYTESDVENCLCPLCSSDKFTFIYRERGNLGIVRCNNCDLIYTNPRAKDAEQNYFGDIDIYLEEAKLVFNSKKPHHRDRNYEHEVREIKKYKSFGKLLDIGCNMGFFLRKAKEGGFNVTGVEPSLALSTIAKEKFGLSVVNSYFNKEKFESQSYDVITMIDVFEHVTNPKDLLTDAHHVLKDDGILCIKVPNGNYNVLKLKLAKLFGREKNHDLFDSCEHVVHYSVETMKKMLAQNGFKIKKVIVPLPINVPVWASLVGHYYQYPSPFILDWKRRTLRNLFYVIGRLQGIVGLKITFGPDLMFFAIKTK